MTWSDGEKDSDVGIWLCIVLMLLAGMCGGGNPYDCVDTDPTQYSDC